MFAAYTIYNSLFICRMCWHTECFVEQSVINGQGVQSELRGTYHTEHHWRFLPEFCTMSCRRHTRRTCRSWPLSSARDRSPLAAEVQKIEKIEMCALEWSSWQRATKLKLTASAGMWANIALSVIGKNKEHADIPCRGPAHRCRKCLARTVCRRWRGPSADSMP